MNLQSKSSTIVVRDSDNKSDNSQDCAMDKNTTTGSTICHELGNHSIVSNLHNIFLSNINFI